MIGNIFSGLLSLAQGDDPDEILKKQFITTMMGGQVPAGVDSASTIAPHLAQTGAEQAVASGIGGELATQLGSEVVTQNPALTNGLGESSNMLTQLGRDAGGAMTDAFGPVGDKLSEYGTEINDFTGMENKDWTKLGIQGGVGALSAPPPKRVPPAAMGQGISKPMGPTPPNQGSLLSSNPAMGQTGGQQLTPEEIMKLKRQGIL
jgi:hypothetical protein